MHIINISDIRDLLVDIDIISVIEEGFIQFSSGMVQSFPVSGIEFRSPPGDVHIKSGYITDAPEYVVKIASGFYENPLIGMPSSNGMMLVFCRKTGTPRAILLDEGLLTDVRTAVAGALSARQFSPCDISSIGMVGAGTQARLHLKYLKEVTQCRNVALYARSESACVKFAEEMGAEGFNVNICDSISDLAARSRLIVTTTCSRQPLLMADQVRPGTHITAVGADTPGKQEIDAKLFRRASLVVADSVRQCVERGECRSAIRDGYLSVDRISEFGSMLLEGRVRSLNDDITITDLTGLAVQDIRISTAVYHRYLKTLRCVPI